MSTHRSTAPPLLLVSVRDANEAAAAVAGGCQILDVKEPAHGSLGFAGSAIVEEVARVGSLSGVPVSAALGEVAAWREADVPVLPPGLAYAKLGLSQLGRHDDWRGAWRAVRDRFDRNGGPNGWIAVAYADWQAAGAPPPDEVVAAATDRAADPRCAGLLFDTWDKSAGVLTDLIPAGQLAGWIRRLRVAGQLAGIAGRLRPESLPSLLAEPPSVVAVRSAACREANRSGPIDVEAVRRLRRILGGFSD